MPPGRWPATTLLWWVLDAAEAGDHDWMARALGELLQGQGGLIIRHVDLRQVARNRRTGTIHPGDLPPECWSVSRPLLSPLESIERDAIVQTLLDHHGSKAKGAGSLGMSRATIYRKIHQYGIITPAS